MMGSNEAPCKGCKDRVPEPNCHITCEKYIEFDKKMKQQRYEKLERKKTYHKY